MAENGTVDIPLADDDLGALKLMLGILHDDKLQIPVKIDLTLLTKVAVLVDKYQWHSLVAPHAESWLGSLVAASDVQKASKDDTLTWLWMA